MNGKGDKPRNNFSARYRSNYDEIFRSKPRGYREHSIILDDFWPIHEDNDKSQEKFLRKFEAEWVENPLTQDEKSDKLS